jgi:hypothetical protein
MRMAALVLAAAVLTAPAMAQEATVTISVRNHKFEPARPTAPANVPITLRIRNLDPTPMEFESVSLRVEKVVVGHGEGVIHLRALSPGDYQFFDDFHQETKGTLVVSGGKK